MTKENTRFYDIVIVIQVILYIVLTTAIIVVHRKIAILENNSAQYQSQQVTQATNQIYNEKAKQMEEKLAQVPVNSTEAVEARKELAEFSYQQGNMLSAIEHYNKLLSQQPQDAEIHLKLGQLYMSQRNTQQQALNHLKKVLEISPDHIRKPSIQAWIKALKNKTNIVKNSEVEKLQKILSNENDPEKRKIVQSRIDSLSKMKEE